MKRFALVFALVLLNNIVQCYHPPYSSVTLYKRNPYGSLPVTGYRRSNPFMQQATVPKWAQVYNKLKSQLYPVMPQIASTRHNVYPLPNAQATQFNMYKKNTNKNNYQNYQPQNNVGSAAQMYQKNMYKNNYQRYPYQANVARVAKHYNMPMQQTVVAKPYNVPIQPKVSKNYNVPIQQKIARVAKAYTNPIQQIARVAKPYNIPIQQNIGRVAKSYNIPIQQKIARVAKHYSVPIQQKIVGVAKSYTIPMQQNIARVAKAHNVPIQPKMARVAKPYNIPMQQNIASVAKAHNIPIQQKIARVAKHYNVPIQQKTVGVGKAYNVPIQQNIGRVAKSYNIPIQQKIARVATNYNVPLQRKVAAVVKNYNIPLQQKVGAAAKNYNIQQKVSSVAKNYNIPNQGQSGWTVNSRYISPTPRRAYSWFNPPIRNNYTPNRVSSPYAKTVGGRSYADIQKMYYQQRNAYYQNLKSRSTLATLSRKNVYQNQYAQNYFNGKNIGKIHMPYTAAKKIKKNEIFKVSSTKSEKTAKKIKVHKVTETAASHKVNATLNDLVLNKTTGNKAHQKTLNRKGIIKMPEFKKHSNIGKNEKNESKWNIAIINDDNISTRKNKNHLGLPKKTAINEDYISSHNNKNNTNPHGKVVQHVPISPMNKQGWKRHHIFHETSTSEQPSNVEEWELKRVHVYHKVDPVQEKFMEIKREHLTIPYSIDDDNIVDDEDNDMEDQSDGDNGDEGMSEDFIEKTFKFSTTG